MQIEEFNQYVKDHIKEYLPEYETAKVFIQEVTKSNDRMLSGLTILREGENFSPTVYLEPLRSRWHRGAPWKIPCARLQRSRPFTMHMYRWTFPLYGLCWNRWNGANYPQIPLWKGSRKCAGTGKRTYCTGGTTAKLFPDAKGKRRMLSAPVPAVVHLCMRAKRAFLW